MTKAIKLRPVATKDENFLKRVYAQSRDTEMQSIGWPTAQQKAFLESQFTLRAMSYAAEYPRAKHQIILYKARAVGTLLYQIEPNQLELIDIALLKAARSKGIGHQIVSKLCETAEALSIPVRLNVQADNLNAKKLYESLGFLKTKLSGSHYEMRWTPEV